MPDRARRDCVVSNTLGDSLLNMSSAALRKVGMRTAVSGRRVDAGKNSLANSDVRTFRLLDTVADGCSDARARLRTCAAAPDPQASEKVCFCMIAAI